jgi:hypothetical protein
LRPPCRDRRPEPGIAEHGRRKLKRLRFYGVRCAPTPLPPRKWPDLEVGYYIWVEEAEREAAEVEREGPAEVPLDPVYDEHLEFLAHHPGFEQAVLALREKEATAEQFSAAAAHWRITEPDLLAFVEAPDDDVVLDVAGDKSFVEVRPTMFVLRIPRPVTPARRAAVEQWLKEQREWRHPVEQGETLAEGAPVRFVDIKSGYASPTLREHLDWYDRFAAGQSAREIAESTETWRHDETFVRNTLQRIHRRMREISPRGLRSPGP